MNDYPEKFLRICRTAAPGCPKHRLESLCHQNYFYGLWVSRRLMFNCSLLTAHGSLISRQAPVAQAGEFPAQALEPLVVQPGQDHAFAVRGLGQD